ncbi:MAG: hypothetical protein JNK64_37790 [Myxococcales bacterium]|nr:hypothetical protein [Myxococcales bacterium]
MVHHRAAVALLALGALATCGRGRRAPDSRLEPARDAVAGRPRLRQCTGRPFTPAPAESWRHRHASPITTLAGEPRHAADDAIAVAGGPLVIAGKFAYGMVSKDLEEEDVLVFLDDCTGWVALGRHTTDEEGRIAVPAPALPVGVYQVELQVAGDQSRATGWLWVVPAGTHVVVTDIDATLTTSDREVFAQILDGSVVPEPYPGAAALTVAHRERGHVVIYLTGRPAWLADASRAWLARLGFAPGPLRLARAKRDVLPHDDGVGAFKRGQLAGWRAAGLVVDAAYGNASTDLTAYLGAGLPADAVWIIGPHGGEQGTHAVAGDWTPRAAAVAQGPRVAQPFDW